MANCSAWICEPNDCTSSSPYELILGNVVTENIDYSNGTFSPSIRIGSATFEVKLKLGTLVQAKIISVSPSVSISTTQPIPGAVISEATKYCEERAENWLWGASTNDAFIAFLSQFGQDPLEDLAEAGIGQNPWRGQYKPWGSLHGSPLSVQYVTIDYYTTGSLEGCDNGTSSSYGADGYPCGFGKFNIGGDLWWEAPPVNAYTPFVLDNFMNRATIDEIFRQQLIQPIPEVISSLESQISTFIPSVERHNFVSASASVPSQEGGNSLAIGLGVFTGLVNINAFNPDGSQVNFQFNAVKFADPAFNAIDDPALQGLARVTYASSFTLSVGQMSVDAATGKTQQSINTFKKILNPPRQQAIQQRVVYQTQVNTIIQGAVDGAQQQTAPVAGQPVQSGSLSTSGVIINDASAATQNSVPGSRCWLARAVYGEYSIEWLKFREYLNTQAPKWMHDFYMEYAPKIAKKLKQNNLKSKLLKNILKPWMNKKIRNISL